MIACGYNGNISSFSSKANESLKILNYQKLLSCLKKNILKNLL